MDRDFLISVISELQNAIGCPVIKANQTKAEMPAYPFASFTVTTPLVANGGTWHEDGESVYKPFEQTWSFTFQSDKDSEALELAMKAYEWFDRKNPMLTEKGITVRRLYDINNRDSFITIQYEHRYGFDVTFALMRQATNIVPDVEKVDIKIEFEEGKK